MFGGYVILVVRQLLDPAWSTTGLLWWLWLAFPMFATVQLALVLVVAPSLHARRIQLGYVRDMVSFFVYGVRWMPSMAAAITRSRDHGMWEPTAHTRDVSLRDIRRRN